jgi:flagellar protein FliO/FliZ
MEWVEYSRFILALLFVIALIGLAAWFARKLGLMPSPNAKLKPGQRLQIMEMINVDAKRKLMLVRHDQNEHLILIGGESDVVISSGSKRKTTKLNNELSQNTQGTIEKRTTPL